MVSITRIIFVSGVWFLLITSSPAIVSYSRDLFQISGWLAIGEYSFSYTEGFIRSAIYALYTLPIILSIYFAFPSITRFDRSLRLRMKPLSGYIFILLISFNIIAFIFSLGITGVEVDTGGWRLSGAVHYIRSYLFLLIVSYYIFTNAKPSVTLVVLYAFVAGVTSGSRFVIVTPIVLLILKEMGNKNILYHLKMIVILIVGYICITALRLILYADDYEFLNLVQIAINLEIDSYDIVKRGITEFFLRLGLGRDVILAYEVKANNLCTNYYGLFFKSGACFDGALDFYGFINDQTRFGIDPPAIASYFTSLGNPNTKAYVIIGYSLWSYTLCRSTTLLNNIPHGRYFVMPMYYMQSVFIIIGPIKFALYITITIILIYITMRLQFRRRIKTT